jgi:hypothetical protein
MRKSFVLATMVLLFGFGLQSFAVVIPVSDPVGTWTYKAPTAPDGYGSGDIVIAKDKETYTASLKFGDYEIKGTGVKFEKDVLTFKVFIEGEYISVKATIAADDLKGTASYSEGDLPFTGKRKPVKK